jgi:hypothetical protein
VVISVTVTVLCGPTPGEELVIGILCVCVVTMALPLEVSVHSVVYVEKLVPLTEPEPDG